MNADDSEEIDVLLATASEIDPREWAGFLDERCVGRPQIRAEVESLLAAHRRASGFLSVPTPGLSAVDSMTTAGPRSTTIGAFRLVEAIGAGGMGTVYRAERADGGFEQQVAIKVIATPISHAGAARRFRAERQILASLSHPNIVSLLDGGVTSDGSAYLVMEYVEGRPIDAYCREHNLTLADRLRLFRTVCSAVHYAHRHAIVHRDLKPANILVTADGVPKVLDFGVAKLVDESATGATVTALGVGPLTPNYASPEQLRGLALTTSSDVYALGVLLYELVAGVRPYETAGKPLDQVMRLVLDAEPLRPSAAPSASASRLPYDPRRMLRGDLDAVILKAMSKEPERRYGSAEELAEDIARCLAHAPVTAREPSFGYVARKLAARHKAAFATASVSLVVIVSALLLAIWQARVATAERDRAQAEAAKAQVTARFLGGMFQSANPVQARGQAVTARDLLDRATASIATDLKEQPEVQAALLIIMSEAYERLNVKETALALAEQSLQLRERARPPHDIEIGESLLRVGTSYRRLGRSAQALPFLERALTLREAALGPRDRSVAETARNLALALWNVGRTDRVEGLFRRAIQIEEESAPHGARLALLYSNLGNWLSNTADVAGARAAFARSIAMYERIDGPDAWGMVLPLLSLGDLLVEQEELDAAQARFEQALEIDNRVYGTESAPSAYVRARLGEVARAKGDMPRAKVLLQHCLDVYGKSLPPAQPEFAAPLTYLGKVFMAEGKPKEALPLFERVLRIQEQSHGTQHLAVAEALVNVASAQRELEGSAAADPLLRRALDMQRKTLVAGHRFLVPTLTSLAETVLARGAAAEARSLLIEAVDIARARMPEHHSERRRAEAALDRLQSAVSTVKR